STAAANVAAAARHSAAAVCGNEMDMLRSFRAPVRRRHAGLENFRCPLITTEAIRWGEKN
ncbi:MAG TPA: hypothetical protein VGM74_00935, partial [Burkholderiaceae bacterium]